MQIKLSRNYSTIKKVRRCPFCGHYAIVCSVTHEGKTNFHIECSNYKCGAKLKEYDHEQLAIDKWNTRYNTRTCHIEYPYYGDALVINGQPRCSECKTEFVVGMFPNYCPNCGAKVVYE